jgi:hypothetical protein
VPTKGEVIVVIEGSSARTESFTSGTGGGGGMLPAAEAGAMLAIIGAIWVTRVGCEPSGPRRR